MSDEVAGMVVKLAMEDGSFQDSINNLNRQMKLVDSEFKGAVGNTKDFGDSVDGLKANLDRLNKVTEIQSQLIGKYQEKLDKSKLTLEQNVAAQEKLTVELEKTKKAYEESASTVGKNADETIALKKALDQLEKQYEDNNTKIRNNVKTIDNHTVAVNNAKAKLKDFESQAEATGKAINDFGKDMDNVNKSGGMSLGTLNVAMGNLVADGVQMLIGSLKDLTMQAIEYAAELNKLSLQTGMHTDELQKWDYVLQQTGSSIREADGDMAMLAERINEASMGTGEGLEVWNQLGMTVVDTSGKLKSQGQVLEETILALQNMEDVTKRNALASQLLGTTGENLMPILNKTNEELIAMKENASVVSEEDLEAINEFKQVFMEFVSGTGKDLMGVLGDIAVLLTPILELTNAIVKPLMYILHAFTTEIAKPFRETEKQVAETNQAIVKDYKSTTEQVEGLELQHQENMKALQEVGKSWAERMADKQMKKYEEQYKNDTLANAIYLEKKRKQYEEYFARIADLKIKTVGGSNSNSNIPAYANGTNYHPGGLAIVGEQGPELINLERGSSVTPNDKTQRLLKGTTYNFSNITIQTNNPQDFFEEIQRIARRGGVIA